MGAYPFEFATKDAPPPKIPLLFNEIGGYYGDDLGGQTHARVHAGTTDPQPGAEPATGSTGSRPSVQRPAALLPSPSPLHAQHLNLA